MREPFYDGFRDELQKIAKGRDVGQLLSSLAQRSGVNPSSVGAIRQASHAAAQGNRGRAAEIAQNVRGFLKSRASKAA